MAEDQDSIISSTREFSAKIAEKLAAFRALEVARDAVVEAVRAFRKTRCVSTDPLTVLAAYRDRLLALDAAGDALEAAESRLRELEGRDG